MKTFNLSQSYPTQDIRKHTSFLTISLSACLLAAGLILLFLPEINSQSNIDILRMVAGSLMVCIAVYLLVFRARYQALCRNRQQDMQEKPDFHKGSVPPFEQISGRLLQPSGFSRQKGHSYICR
mgnify:CR=1 FL=1